MASEVVWVDRELFNNTAQLDAKMVRAMVAVMEFSRPRVENFMKMHAPWTDRTANARNSLSATTNHGGSFSEIIAAHGVSYGIWLEVAHGGVYGIILRTIREMGAEVMANMRGLFARL